MGGLGLFWGRFVWCGGDVFCVQRLVLSGKLAPRCSILWARTAVISEKSVYFAGCKNDVWP